jgi:Protein of unknown function (DUF3617)
MILRYAALSLLLGLHLPAAAQPPRKDGNWEITMQIAVDGAAPRLPPRVTTQCITAEEAANSKPMPDGIAVPDKCAASDHKVEGNKVSWSFKCDLPSPISGSGEIVYADENSYTGVITFVRNTKTMTLTYSGKRLGDCTK